MYIRSDYQTEDGAMKKWDYKNDYIWIIVGPMATVLIVSFF